MYRLAATLLLIWLSATAVVAAEQVQCQVGKYADTRALVEPATAVRYRANDAIAYAGVQPKPFSMIVFHDPGSATCDPLAMIRYGQTYDKKRDGMFGYHFYIAQDGTVFQGAPLTRRTNHVSGSYHRTPLRYANASAIGITLMCGHKKIPEAQLKAAVVLAHTLQVAYSIPSAKIFGHGELQYNRMPNEGLIAARAARTSVPVGVSAFLLERNKSVGQCVVDGPTPPGCSRGCEIFSSNNDITSIPGLPESFYRILSGNTGYDLPSSTIKNSTRIPLPGTQYPRAAKSILFSEMTTDARAWGYGSAATLQPDGVTQTVFGNPLKSGTHR
jgi:N-acetylmuramoyl-L-alanine amidase